MPLYNARQTVFWLLQSHCILARTMTSIHRDLVVEQLIQSDHRRVWCVRRAETVLARMDRIDHAFTAARRIARSEGGEIWLAGVKELVPIRR